MDSVAQTFPQLVPGCLRACIPNIRHLQLPITVSQPEMKWAAVYPNISTVKMSSIMPWKVLFCSLKTYETWESGRQGWSFEVSSILTEFSNVLGSREDVSVWAKKKKIVTFSNLPWRYLFS